MAPVATPFGRQEQQHVQQHVQTQMQCRMKEAKPTMLLTEAAARHIISRGAGGMKNNNFRYYFIMREHFPINGLCNEYNTTSIL